MMRRYHAMRRGARGQTMVEMGVLFATVVAVLLAMSMLARRAVGGYLSSAFHANGGSPYLPGATDTLASTQFHVEEDRVDTFRGSTLLDETGAPLQLSRVSSELKASRTEQHRRERVTLNP